MSEPQTWLDTVAGQFHSAGGDGRLPEADDFHQADQEEIRMEARRKYDEARRPGQLPTMPHSEEERLKAFALVSRAGNTSAISCQGVEDLLGGFLPDERLRVLVPRRDPGADVGFQGLHALVGAAADHLIGEEPEPPLHLIDP